MARLPSGSSAIDVPTRFVDVCGRRLAYRQIGAGPPLVLCLRLRGVLDVWDPAFLDALAERFTVITFDYSGLGQSTGEASYDRTALARDALDLIDALGLERVVIGGWSLGGLAAQVFAASHSERTSHVILIGTGPPGPPTVPPEPIFLPTAMKPENDLDDELVLFFEPASRESRERGRASRERIAARRADRSPVVPEALYLRLVREAHDPKAVFPDPDGAFDRFFRTTALPVLAICGDHDPMFPVENWYALNRHWPSLHVLTFPRAGHGPQHQFPEICADAIGSFVANTCATDRGDAALDVGVGDRIADASA